MKYSELSEKWQKEAVRMGLNLLNQIGKEMARENGVEPYIYTEIDEELKDYLKYNSFAIRTDEVTNQQFLDYDYE